MWGGARSGSRELGYKQCVVARELALPKSLTYAGPGSDDIRLWLSILRRHLHMLLRPVPVQQILRRPEAIETAQPCRLAYAGWGRRAARGGEPPDEPAGMPCCWIELGGLIDAGAAQHEIEGRLKSAWCVAVGQPICQPLGMYLEKDI